MGDLAIGRPGPAGVSKRPSRRAKTLPVLKTELIPGSRETDGPLIDFLRRHGLDASFRGVAGRRQSQAFLKEATAVGAELLTAHTAMSAYLQALKQIAQEIGRPSGTKLSDAVEACLCQSDRVGEALRRLRQFLPHRDAVSAQELP